MKSFELNPNTTYRLIAITDRMGNDKSQTNDMYRNRINCLATNFQYDDISYNKNLHRLTMDFIENAAGQPIKRKLHTSLVYEVVETADGMTIYTHNSIYVFQNAVAKKISFQNVANLIELYLTDDDGYYFELGYLYDENKVVHALTRNLHIGMFQDSVLIDTVDKGKFKDCVCRFFPQWGGIEFYDTLYHQQDYELPILIHNTGTTPLIIRFQGIKAKWTVPPGESKRIIPYNVAGADESNMNEIIQTLQPLPERKD